MKHFMILATAALVSSSAFAQTARVEIAPDQRTKIKCTDLPLNCHPAAAKASANVTPFGAMSVPA